MKHMISLLFPECLHYSECMIRHENSITILSNESAPSLDTPANLVFGPSCKELTDKRMATRAATVWTWPPDSRYVAEVAIHAL